MNARASENDAIMARAASRRAVAVAIACAAVTVGVSRRVLAVACAAETARATREAQTMMALRSLGVAPEAWTRATRADETRGDSRAREQLAKKAFRRIALRAHPDKRRGANEVGDAFEAAAKAFETVRTTTTTTTTTRRRAMRDRAVARACATVSRFESFVVDRARGMIPTSRRTRARASAKGFEDASTSIRDDRDDDDDDDDAHFATNEESFWTRAIRALEDEDDDEEVANIDVDVAERTRAARDAYPGRRGEREL